MAELIAVFSGPESKRARVEVAFEKGRLVLPDPDHPAVLRRSYSAEDWSHLSPTRSGEEPEETQGFIAVLVRDVNEIDWAAEAVEKHGWLLRVHYEVPPVPEPVRDVFGDLNGRVARLEAQVEMLLGRGA